MWILKLRRVLKHYLHFSGLLFVRSVVVMLALIVSDHASYTYNNMGLI